MKLHHFPNSCSRASHIALEEAGADYELALVNLYQGEQRTPEYLAVNPKGRVPVLETERGLLTETPAILAYIAMSYPQARLAPLDDPFAFAEVQALNAFLSSSVHVAFAHRFRPGRYAHDESAHPAIKATVPSALREYFGILEDRMRGPWAMGEAYTISDPYLFVMTGWLGRDGLGDLNDYPRLLDHAKRMRDRPAVQKVLAVEEACQT